MDQEDNVVDLEGRPDSTLASLLADYSHCSERRRAAIRRFAHRLAELDSPPHLSAQILPFPSI